MEFDTLDPIGSDGLILSRDAVAGERNSGSRASAGRGDHVEAAGMTSTVQPAAGSAAVWSGARYPPGSPSICTGMRCSGRHHHFLGPTMEHARIVEVGSSKDFPQDNTKPEMVRVCEKQSRPASRRRHVPRDKRQPQTRSGER